MTNRKRPTRTITHLNSSRNHTKEVNTKPKTCAAALIIFIVSLIATFPYEKSVISSGIPSVGDVSQETVIAPKNFTVYKDSGTIENEKRRIIATVLPVFRYKPAETRHMERKRAEISDAFTHISSNPDSLLSCDSTMEKWKDQFKILNRQEVQSLAQNHTLLEQAEELFSQYISQGIRSKTAPQPPGEDITREDQKLLQTVIQRLSNPYISVWYPDGVKDT
ncbi:MAG: hypothetical protein ACQEQ4_03690, partial [Fibrobacterota bacterium]